MKIECTVEELKELIKTPVAGTTDVIRPLNTINVKVLLDNKELFTYPKSRD